MKSFEDFVKKVEEYQREYLNLEDLKFEVYAPPYNLKKDWKNKNLSYPFCHDAGVYAIFGEKKELLYIGKSVCIGERLGQYFNNNEDGDCLVVDSPESWCGNPLYISAVKVQHVFEASSLEEFLILELDPPSNIRGKKTPK